MGNVGQLPDPRFRKAMGVNELQNLVNMLLHKNQIRERFTVNVMSDTVFPTARYPGVLGRHQITVNAQALRNLPADTWGFILGHEIAQGVDLRARMAPGKIFKRVEWNADEPGACYAIRAGLKLEAHLA